MLNSFSSWKMMWILSAIMLNGRLSFDSKTCRFLSQVNDMRNIFHSRVYQIYIHGFPPLSKIKICLRKLSQAKMASRKFIWGIFFCLMFVFPDWECCTVKQNVCITSEIAVDLRRLWRIFAVTTKKLDVRRMM